MPEHEAQEPSYSPSTHSSPVTASAVRNGLPVLVSVQREEDGTKEFMVFLKGLEEKKKWVRK